MHIDGVHFVRRHALFQLRLGLCVILGSLSSFAFEYVSIIDVQGSSDDHTLGAFLLGGQLLVFTGGGSFVNLTLGLSRCN